VTQNNKHLSDDHIPKPHVIANLSRKNRLIPDPSPIVTMSSSPSSGMRLDRPIEHVQTTPTYSDCKALTHSSCFLCLAPTRGNMKGRVTAPKRHPTSPQRAPRVKVALRSLSKSPRLRSTRTASIPRRLVDARCLRHVSMFHVKPIPATPSPIVAMILRSLTSASNGPTSLILRDENFRLLTRDCARPTFSNLRF
jgi:hypothetical protein